MVHKCVVLHVHLSPCLIPSVCTTHMPFYVQCTLYTFYKTNFIQLNHLHSVSQCDDYLLKLITTRTHFNTLLQATHPHVNFDEAIDMITEVSKYGKMQIHCSYQVYFGVCSCGWACLRMRIIYGKWWAKWQQQQISPKSEQLAFMSNVRDMPYCRAVRGLWVRL